MCDDVPRLDPRSAADRLAQRYDVPELTTGVLDREPTRDHGKYLKTTPAGGPFVKPSTAPRPWLSTGPAGYADPGAFARLIHL